MQRAPESHVRSKRGYYDGCPERSSRHPSIKVGVGFSQSLFIFFTSTSASDFAIVEPSEKMYMRFACLRVSSSRSNVVGTKCLLQNSLSRNPTVREPRYQTCHNVARVTQTLILIDSSPPTFTPGPRTLPHKLQIEVVRIKVYAFGPWVNCGCITSEVRQGPTFISYRRWKQTCLIGSMNYRPMS